MATVGGAAQRCQRIGCDASFTDDDNTEGSCRYHPSVLDDCSRGKCCNMIYLTVGLHLFFQGPLFHDGMKEWSCCKQKSHDFSLFLALPGCQTGKHTTEKPMNKIVSANPSKPAPVQYSVQNKTTADNCSRCRQGFFCSDHGSQGKPSKPTIVASTIEDTVLDNHPPPKKIVGLNEPQICKNKGCGITFKEKDNHETACKYHPGPPVFHDRLRGWKCCDVYEKEFDDFMNIPPCSKGWHNADE